MVDYNNIESFYNNLIQNINNDDSNLYKLLSEEQKIISKQKNIRTEIIIQNKKSRIYFKEIFYKYFPNTHNTPIKTDDIMIIIKEILKINPNMNFSEEIDKLKNKYVKQFIKNQSIKEHYITDFKAIIIGCHESTDIDVIIIVDEKLDINTIKINNSDITEELKKSVYMK